MTPGEIKAREESYRKLQEMAKRHSKPRGGFRTLGDELSGHEGAVLAFGLKQAAEPRPTRPGTPKSAG
jgi:hypothetical protein